MPADVQNPHNAAPPRLSASVRLERAGGPDSWLVTVDGVPVSRASVATTELLRAMDGATSVAELHRRFAPEQPTGAFADLIDRFRHAGLLEGSERPLAGRMTYRPPLTIQFATLRAPELFEVLHRVLRPVLGRWVPWGAAVCVVLGGAALIMQASGAITALTSPLPMVDVLIVAVVLVAATFAHEAAHGVMLTSAGARPRRAGVMLLYLGPAFFVDVTDAWRLPSRRLRVAVALAGPAVHAVMGGAAALAALFTTDPDVRRTLLVLSCACAAVVLVNLVPFVRFDGYIALMSAVDEPNLRARTMADAGATVRWLLFGTEPPPRALARWWSVPFGLLSVAVPTTLVWFALERAVRALSGTGALGAFLALALQVVVLVAVGVPVARWLAASVRQGRRRLRGLVMGATLLAAIITAAAVVPVADARAAGFLLVDGRPVLVVPADGSAAVPVTAGTPVELMTSGILGDARVAVGTVRPQTSWTLSVPISAFTPLAATGVRVEATAVGVVDVAAGDALPSAGRASVQLGTRSLLSQVWSSHVTGPLSTLLTAFPSSLSGSQEGQS